MVIKKGRMSRPYDLASPSVFFVATFSPKEMREKKRLNSFASVLVSLVYW